MRETKRRKELQGSSNRLGLNVSEIALQKLWSAIGDVERALPRSPFFRVCIFGTARIGPDHPVFIETRRLAREVARLGGDVVSGGGPGTMKAANLGAIESGNTAVRSYGIRIELPREEEPNGFLSDEFMHGNFFTRLHQFARLGSVFVNMDGGEGSLLELMVVWQLLQVGHLKGTPLILVGDMWTGLIDWQRQTMLARGYVEQWELDIPILVPTVDEAIPIIAEALGRFKLKNAAG